jgi:hypothetical protein
MMNRVKYIILIFNKSNYCRKLAPARVLTQDSLHERRRPFIKETAASCMVALAAGQGVSRWTYRPGCGRDKRLRGLGVAKFSAAKEVLEAINEYA